MTTLLVPRHNVPARRLNPFSLLGDFDRLLGSAWPVAPTHGPSNLAPRIDIHETDEAWRIDAELPGLEREDIAVDVEDGVLTISGERKSETAGEKERFRHLERFRGSFRRSLRLPEGSEGDDVKATYKNGVLSVTVPKPPEARPEVLSIPISVE